MCVCVCARACVYVSIFYLAKNPKVTTPMWVGVGHVRKHYIEFKCLPSLDLKVSTMECACACVRDRACLRAICADVNINLYMKG